MQGYFKLLFKKFEESLIRGIHLFRKRLRRNTTNLNRDVQD